MSADAEDAQKRQLYNRQEYVVGAETQAKYGTTDVLVVGACGLGAELVKNLALAGVRSIVIADATPAALEDLGTNFFLSPGDIGRPRAEVVAQRAQELNRFVRVTAAASGALIEELIPHASVVVFANAPTTRLVSENQWARRHGVKFVACESRGIAGCVFVDGGPEFDVMDPDGEETVSCVITSISPDGIVTLHEDKKHECEVGSHVFFTGVVSPAGINSDVDPATLHGGRHAIATTNAHGVRLFEVQEVISPFILRLRDFSCGTEAINIGTGSYLHTTKRQVRMAFCDLAASVKAPQFSEIFDAEEKINAPATLHAVFQALHNHQNQQQQQYRNQLEGAVDVESIVRNAAGLCHDNNFDAGAARLVVSVAHGRLNPMTCIIGGLASQEVLKVASGKFTPVYQWLYYDAREILEARGELPRDGSSAHGPFGRYKEQIDVLGSAFQEHLSKQRAFIVGAGALGCELIKNAACMGFGGVSITDMDTIEMSNLSRQFLFRSSHIGRYKSQVAGEAARNINADMQVKFFVEKVGPETEGIFNEEFWNSHAVIINALDNVTSRKYVDARCLFYKKPLFESGTLGAKCNMQCVIPFCTESYSSSYDPPEKAIPLCTLKNFPNAIEHTIQWARDNFFSLFTNTPTDVNAYLDDPAAFAAALERDPATKATVLKDVRDALKHWPTSDADCVRLARLLYHEYFNATFRQLLHNIPVDKRSENGELFWSGAKKPPVPQDFTMDSPRDVDFVYHCAHLLAHVYGLPPFSLSQADAARIAQGTSVPTFVPHQVSFSTNETDKAEQASSQLAGDLSMADLLPVSSFAGRRMIPQEFEKDDPTNHHVEYITCCSNLRAVAYNIPPADVHHTRRIAGNIIPAMVTTTALVTGLVGLEVLKFLLLEVRRPEHERGTPLAPETVQRQLSIYRNAFVNIALPFMAFSDPIIAPGTTHQLPSGRSVRWGIWDRIDVNEGRDVTVKELVTLLETRYEVEIFIIALSSGKMIFSQFGNAKDRGNLVSDVARSRGEEPQDGEDYCCLIATGAIGDADVEIPLVRYKYRNF